MSFLHLKFIVLVLRNLYHSLELTLLYISYQHCQEVSANIHKFIILLQKLQNKTEFVKLSDSI